MGGGTRVKIARAVTKLIRRNLVMRTAMETRSPPHPSPSHPLLLVTVAATTVNGQAVVMTFVRMLQKIGVEEHQLMVMISVTTPVIRTLISAVPRMSVSI